MKTKTEDILVSVEQRSAAEEVVHGLGHVLVHPDVERVEVSPLQYSTVHSTYTVPDVERVEILPAQLEQLLVEVDECPHDVDGLGPLRRLEVVVRGHGAVPRPRLHAVQDVGGEQRGQVVGVHLVPRHVLG